jgi:hypothetical protein
MSSEISPTETSSRPPPSFHHRSSIQRGDVDFSEIFANLLQRMTTSLYHLGTSRDDNNNLPNTAFMEVYRVLITKQRRNVDHLFVSDFDAACSCNGQHSGTSSHVIS